MDSTNSEINNPFVSLSRQLGAVVERISSRIVAVDARPRVRTSGVIWRPGVIISTNHTVRRDDEITVSFGDGRQVKAALAGRDPGTDLAVLRVESDGKDELFLIETDGALVPAFGTIQLMDLRGRTPSVKWSQTNSAWIWADLLGMDATWSTSAAQGMRQVLLSVSGRGERPAFLVAQRKADADAPTPTTVTAMRAGKGRKPEPF